MPGRGEANDYYCDEHIPRGCGCQLVYVDDNHCGPEKYTDEFGRELPCCEYDFNLHGYDSDGDGEDDHDW
jgi:hypothetical protein